MKIEFCEDILEYKNGDYYRKNEGNSFEVDARFGSELIATGYFQQITEEITSQEAEKAEKSDESTDKSTESDSESENADAGYFEAKSETHIPRLSIGNSKERNK